MIIDSACFLAAFLTVMILLPCCYFFIYGIIYKKPTFIVEKQLLKSQKKQKKYKEQLKRLSILNDSEAKSKLVEEIENKLIHEEFNSISFYYELKQKKINKQKKELYRKLKKNDVLEGADNFDGIKITDKKTRTQYIFNEESVLERKGE